MEVSDNGRGVEEENFEGLSELPSQHTVWIFMGFGFIWRSDFFPSLYPQL